MTQGMIQFVSGIGILILAFLLLFVFLFTAKREKRRIDEKMKEKY